MSPHAYLCPVDPRYWDYTASGHILANVTLYTNSVLVKNTFDQSCGDHVAMFYTCPSCTI